MPDSPEKQPPKWHHPSEVMKLHKLKLKKKALQARITGNKQNIPKTQEHSAFEDVLLAKKRKNPFISNSDNKKIKPEVVLDESNDHTLFKLFNNKPANLSESFTSFNNLLQKINQKEVEEVEIVKAQGERYAPIDWSLKTKIRLLSQKPFPWNSKLKISEEASGVTGFTRCLDNDSETTLDGSPNAKFHQCCLYWQQPSLPWASLFPRSSTRSNIQSFATNQNIKDSLQRAWGESLKSLFNLLRTRQCPYFYACANSFTILFRAAGIAGYEDVHALITPTTRGFRHMLKQEDIEFKMPLKKKIVIENSGGENELAEAENSEAVEDEAPDEEWLKSMGINAEDIKRINYTQEKITQKAECDVDHSEQSLVLIEGIEVQALYNFLINCKSAIAPTGPFAGIPPTLLAPVAFNGATLNALKVRESKVHAEDSDCHYYSLEIAGPILPTTIHNIFNINSPDHSLTATFNNLHSTLSFSNVTKESKTLERSSVFDKENLKDCGLNPKLIKQFCSTDLKYTTVIECIKYDSSNGTFTWT